MINPWSFDAPEDERKAYNKALCERFPWLHPSHGFIDVSPNYDYDYTLLDDLDDGWRVAFGMRMCEEIQDELEAAGLVDEYSIWQIKEKYGVLRWYDGNGTDKITNEIIPKYEKISAHTCGRCGAPATKISKGWVYPFCDSCAKEYEDTMNFEVAPGSDTCVCCGEPVPEGTMVCPRCKGGVIC